METRQNEKTGRFIGDMRREQGFTQKELADALGVTDKAVSKWERGVSCPDIALIIPLARLLGVTAGELLSGEREAKEEPASVQETAEEAVEKVVTYSRKHAGQKMERIKRFLFMGVSGIFLLSILICLICDFCITGELTWSLIVFSSVLAAWVWLLPFLTFARKAFRKALVWFSISLIPYLALLGYILKAPLLLPLGACVSLVSLLALWGIYGIWVKLKNRKWQALGWSLLVCTALAFVVNHIVAWFAGEPEGRLASDFFNIAVTVVLALFCFCLDYYHSQSQK